MLELYYHANVFYCFGRNTRLLTDHVSENTLFSVFPFPIAFENNGLSKFGGKKKCIMGNAILIPLQKVIIIDKHIARRISITCINLHTL